MHQRQGSHAHLRMHPFTDRQPSLCRRWPVLSHLQFSRTHDCSASLWDWVARSVSRWEPRFQFLPIKWPFSTKNRIGTELILGSAGGEGELGEPVS